MEERRHKPRNRRLSDDDEVEVSVGWRVMYSMGMPLLYIIALLLGLVGVICNGLITSYWSKASRPLCFLYSSTSSLSAQYRFGGPVSACHWVTYGGTVALMCLVASGFIYFIAVRGRGKLHLPLYILQVVSLIGTILMVAVTCSITEGMRQTCASMGLNQYNMRGGDCYEQLDMRIKSYNLSVSSSTLIKGTMYTLWPCAIVMCVITFFHLASCYRRCYR